MFQNCINARAPSHLVGISALFIMSGCFGGPSFLNQKDAYAPASVSLNTRIEGERTSATVSASALTIQTVNAAGSSSIAGARVAIQPGTLNVDTAIYLEESDSLVSAALGKNIGITLSQSAGRSVIVGATGQDGAKLSKPMTLALPLSAAGLNLLADNQTLIVIYRAYADGKLLEGVIPFSKLRISTSEVAMEIDRFGAYQAAYIPSSQQEQAESVAPVESKQKIVSKTEVNKLPTAEISPLTITVAGRIGTFNATVKGAKIESCLLEGIDKKHGEKAFRELGATSSYTEDYAKETEELLFDVRMSCTLVDGRVLTTGFTFLHIPAPTTTTPETTESNSDTGSQNIPSLDIITTTTSLLMDGSENGKTIHAQSRPNTTIDMILPGGMPHGYTVKFINTGTGFVKIYASSESINGELLPLFLYSNGSQATLIRQQNGWLANSLGGDVGRYLCGDSGVNNCYDGPAGDPAITVVGTPNGLILARMKVNGFSFWVDRATSALISSSGQAEFQKRLNSDGITYTTGYLYASDISWISLEGRACPKHVLINGSMLSGRCLYYSQEKTVSFSSDGLINWGSTQRWFVGNIPPCGTASMRLPTLYEVLDSDSPSLAYLPTGDGTPTFSAVTGIPTSSTGSLITATSYADTGNKNFAVAMSNGTVSSLPASTSNAATRCVLP